MPLRLGFLAPILIAALFYPSGSAFGASAPAASDAEWNKTITAAKKEAKVVIIAPSGSDVRDAYTIGFQKKYPEIEVDFSGLRGAEVAPKLLAELNAVKVYIDYLLSREGQISWSKASGLASLRTDVKKDHIPEVLVPDEGVKYQETHLEKYVMMRKEIVDFLNAVIRR